MCPCAHRHWTGGVGCVMLLQQQEITWHCTIPTPAVSPAAERVRAGAQWAVPELSAGCTSASSLCNTMGCVCETMDGSASWEEGWKDIGGRGNQVCTDGQWWRKVVKARWEETLWWHVVPEDTCGEVPPLSRAGWVQDNSGKHWSCQSEMS